jgi:hypothetical protein
MHIVISYAPSTESAALATGRAPLRLTLVPSIVADAPSSSFNRKKVCVKDEYASLTDTVPITKCANTLCSSRKRLCDKEENIRHSHTVTTFVWAMHATYSKALNNLFSYN